MAFPRPLLFVDFVQRWGRQTDIHRFTAMMGLIPSGSSLLQGALGRAGDCQTSGPSLALFSAPALEGSWPPESGFRKQSSGGTCLTG